MILEMVRDILRVILIFFAGTYVLDTIDYELLIRERKVFLAYILHPYLAFKYKGGLMKEKDGE